MTFPSDQAPCFSCRAVNRRFARRVFRCAGVAGWLGLSAIGMLSAAQQVERDVAAAIQVELARSSSNATGFDASQQDLQTFYQRNAYLPVWTDGRGRPNADAAEALQQLRAVADEGLDPFEYQSADLDQQALLLQDAGSPSAARIAAFELRVSVNTLRYLRQLHLGRVDPRAIGFRIVAPSEPHDFPEVLRSALSRHQLAEPVAALAPPLAQYRGLRAMLTTYRSLAADAGLQSLALPTTVAKPGQPQGDLRALYRWLVALGDLAVSTPPPGPVYDGVLVEGVKRFQSRHGLTPDGIIGKETLQALHVPLDWRVRQIELALDRLRWLPDLGEGRFLAVNIPMFHLWAWDALRPDGLFAFDTSVIVGRAVNHKTPVFVADMRYIEFRPYWDVPASIVRSEILPSLARDPDYLRRENMELIRHDGKLTVRQRPGPGNALGLIKFVFPNEHDVYMHATPAQAIFSRTRRDFSHGCIRVEDYVALAEWALKEQPEWTRARIVSAMQGSKTMRVDLVRRIRVILFYLTAAFMPQDGTIRFAQDIYGHDTTLDAALRRHAATAE
jgi:murein L,D-transpeptidase YcbB/YkuD